MSNPFPPASPENERLVAQHYFDVILRGDGIVWLRRTDAVYPSVVSVHAAYDTFLRVVDDWLFDRRIKSGGIGTKAKTPMAWLYDVRAAPARRNDPEFEQVVQDRRADLLKRSPVLSVLVQTASGKMQVTRMARTSSANVLVFDDFDEAVASLVERMQQAF
jgi:hypothetical protein